MKIEIDKNDIHDLSTRIYEIKSPDLGNMEIYKESKPIRKFGANETFLVLDFNSKLDALLAFKVWKDSGAALVGYEESLSIEDDKTVNYEYIHAIIIQMTHKHYNYLKMIREMEGKWIIILQKLEESFMR